MLNEIDDLVNEVRLTFHVMSKLSSTIHGSKIDTAGRAVLEYLIKNGSTPVPEIARDRGVSRQHIQSVVNELNDRCLVDTEPNPAHRRSHLIVLTRPGTEMIIDLIDRERGYIAPAIRDLDLEQVRLATMTLASLRNCFANIGDCE